MAVMIELSANRTMKAMITASLTARPTPLGPPPALSPL